MDDMGTEDSGRIGNIFIQHHFQVGRVQVHAQTFAAHGVDETLQGHCRFRTGFHCQRHADAFAVLCHADELIFHHLETLMCWIFRNGADVAGDHFRAQIFCNVHDPLGDFHPIRCRILKRMSAQVAAHGGDFQTVLFQFGFQCGKLFICEVQQVPAAVFIFCVDLNALCAQFLCFFQRGKKFFFQTVCNDSDFHIFSP